jgi:nucleoside-diphosphate-sugar epimerase
MSALVVLGCGFAGEALARRRLAAGGVVRATVRRDEERVRLRASGIDAHTIPVLTRDALSPIARDGDDLAVCFPPDGHTDAVISPLAAAMRATVYLSSTGVYGDRTGDIDEDTPLDLATDKARARADAEDLWRAHGATVLRAAGIYGPWRGLHRRVLEGRHALPDGGHRVVSRVHVDDLAALMEGCLTRGLRGETFVVADACPVPQREAVAWLCARLGVAEVPVATGDAVPETLRHDRRVNSARVLATTGVRLMYPGYREGFAMCLREEGM